MNALDKLLAAVSKTEVKLDKADTNAIIFDGIDAWNAELDKLDAISPELLELAKSGGNIYAPALSIYAKIQAAVKDMLEAKSIRHQADLDYAKYTGVKLASVLEHNARPEIKVSKDNSVTQPLLKELRLKRESLTIELDVKNIRYTMAESRIKAMPAKDQITLEPLLIEAAAEVYDIAYNLECTTKEIVDISEYCKSLEVEHGYSYNDKNTRVYNKDGEFNQLHSNALKVGRTALTEFKAYAKLGGIEQVIPMAEVKKAHAILGVK